MKEETWMRRTWREIKKRRNFKSEKEKEEHSIIMILIVGEIFLIIILLCYITLHKEGKKRDVRGVKQKECERKNEKWRV